MAVTKGAFFNMKEKLLSNQYFKLFLSYFLVFIIPAALVSSVVFKISDGIIREELQSNHLLQVSTASFNLQNTLDSFSVAATSAAYSGFGRPVNLEEEVGTATQLISLLNRTSLSYGFVRDIFMIYRDGPYIYSGQTSFTRENFYKYLRFSGISPVQAAALIETAESPCCFPVSGLPGSINESERDKDYILFCLPCTRKEYTAGVMAFLVDVERLNLSLGNNRREGYLFLTGPEGNALNPCVDFQEQLSQFEGLTEEQKQGQDMTLSCYTKGAHTYTYGTILPGAVNLVGIADSKNALQRLSAFRNLILLILSGIFVLGTLFALSAYRRNKKDLLRITSSYEQRLREAVPLRRREILYALVEGRYVYENDFAIQCEESMMDFTAAYHCCILLPDPSKNADMELLLSEAAGFHVTLSYSYYVHKAADVNVWLVGTSEKLPSGHKQLSGGSMFLSRPVTRILDIHTAYSEVLSLKYLQQTPNASSAESDENDRRSQPHFDRLLNRINDCLSTADRDGLKSWGDSLLKDMDRDNLSFGMRQKLLLQLFITFPDTYQAPFSIHDILKMEQKDQLDAAFRSLLSVGAQSIATAQTVQDAALKVDKIKAYILDNYTDPDFSLQLLADHFHVSNSYLSWFFKQNYGMTVLDYTTSLKMDLATRLLQQGLTLQQVSLQVGYINVSSFIRRFKQTMGMTPGEYKKELPAASKKG